MATRHRRRFASAAALSVVTALVMSACSGGTQVLGVTVAPSTTAASATEEPSTTAIIATATTRVRTPTTRATRTPTSTAAAGATTTGPAPTSAAAAAPTTAAAAGAAGAPTTAGAPTCASPKDGPDPTLPAGDVVVSSELGLRMAHPAAWPVTAVNVAADQVLPRTLLAETGLAATTVLSPLVVRHPSQFPGLAVFRFRRPAVDLRTTTEILREFAFTRKYLVQDRLLTLCIDGALAVGLLGTNQQYVQATWTLYRGDSMYLLFGLAADDGSSRGQTAIINEFSSVAQSIRWLP